MLWRFATAQSTGAQHVATGTACQDSASCFADDHGNLVIAVSDGAGSASHSDVGSARAVGAASNFLRAHVRHPELPWRDALQAAARSAQGALVMEAARHHEPLQSYACTLLLVALTPQGGGALQIGDGVMVLKNEAGPWQHIFWPQKGEFVNTTRFLTDTDAEQAWEVAELSDIACDAVVMTDGLEALALQFANKSVHAGFFDGVLGPLAAVGQPGVACDIAETLRAFLNSPRVKGRTDDDLTLVVASRSKPT